VIFINHKKLRTLNILFTTDTHGWLLPVNYFDNSKSKTGLSVLASAIKEYDKKNRILIDVGDTIQGSPLMYFHHINQKKYDNPVAKIMNELDYDFFIPGNHDFNYGKEYLADFTDSLNAKTLCQNIYCDEKLIFDNGYEIIDKNGIKLLIVGVTTKYIPNWENPAFIEGYTFADPYLETKKIVEKYRETVDLVVVAYHGGLEKYLHSQKEFVKDTGENQAFKIFSEIKGIDILLTGHQHRVICDKIDNRICIMAGFNGSHLGVIEVEYEDGVKDINAKLVLATSYSSDEKCVELLNPIESANQIFLDEVIGIVPDNNLSINDPITARIEKHPIVDFINNIQLDASKAMLSATSLANIVTGFDKEITVRNVLSTYVYSNTLVVVSITGEILKEYLEKCAEYFIVKDEKIVANPRFSYPKLEHYNYDMIDGIDYTIDLTKPFGSRLTSIKYKNQEINQEDDFTLVLNNYRATGGGDFFMLKDLPIIREIPFNVAELMLDYIRKNHIIKVENKKNIKLIT